jgi:hypothetical protein
MLFLETQSKTTVGESFSNYITELFAKRRKLVKLELDAIDGVKAEWEKILGNTVTDRLKAEAALKACYQAVGLTPPIILWADRPMSVIKILLNRPDLQDLSGTIGHHIWHQSELAIQSQIDPEHTAHVLKHVNPSHIVKTPTGKYPVAAIADRLNELVMNQISDLYRDLTEQTIASPLQDYRIGDLSYFDYFLRIGIDIPQVQLAIDLAKSCGWVWTFEKVAILTPKPSRVELDRHGKIVEIIYDGIDILGDTRSTR